MGFMKNKRFEEFIIPELKVELNSYANNTSKNKLFHLLPGVDQSVG